MYFPTVIELPSITGHEGAREKMGGNKDRMAKRLNDSVGIFNSPCLVDSSPPNMENCQAFWGFFSP